MVFGRGFDSRRLHQFPAKGPFRFYAGTGPSCFPVPPAPDRRGEQRRRRPEGTAGFRGFYPAAAESRLPPGPTGEVYSLTRIRTIGSLTRERGQTAAHARSPKEKTQSCDRLGFRNASCR